MKERNVNKSLVQIACLLRKARSGFGPLIKAYCLLAAVLIGAKTDGRAEALAGWLKPAEYIAIREQAPELSPFRPWFDPAVKLDFQPGIPPAKPQIRTPAEIAQNGYNIWQKIATKEVTKVLFNPYSGEFAGWSREQYQWDIGHGWRYWNETLLYGQYSFYDTLWSWIGPTWGRWQNGETYQYKPNYSDSSGYLADMTIDTYGEWWLTNWGNLTMPNFEVAVAWEVIDWPFGMFKLDAVMSDALRLYSTWRVIIARPGSSQCINPAWDEVPMNYEMNTNPFLIWSYRRLASNNSQLPGWVEGTGM